MAIDKSLVQRHIEALKALKGREVEAGWFASNRYVAGKTAGGKDIDTKLVGMPIARIARIMEFGATIDHPGGTKYINDAIVKGKFVGTRFVGNDFQGDHETTKAHKIVIPARPFMRLAGINFQKTRSNLQKKIADQLVNGKIKPEQALGQIGLAMEACIVDSMKSGSWAPNAPSTVSKKGFDKPLIDSAQMFQGVSSKVT